MEKDKIIWLSAPLSVAKVMITPDKVSYYNNWENVYFDGDFSLLSDLLGTELDFTKVQNLLLGETLFDLKEQKHVVSARVSPSFSVSVALHFFVCRSV